MNDDVLCQALPVAGIAGKSDRRPLAPTEYEMQGYAEHE
jgi:hypothetical protein